MESVMFGHHNEKAIIMFNTKSVSIPTPCHQSWQQMEPNDQGRHCFQCSKTVVDFSKMTTDEIIGHLANTTNVCGRFGEFQLASINRRLDDKNLAGKNSWKKWLVAAGVLGTTFLNRASAQTAPAKPVSTQQTPSVTPVAETFALGKIAMRQEFTINGRIIAKDDMLPIPGAFIRIKGTNTGTQADTGGRFKLDVNGTNATLVINYIGYMSQEVAVNNTAAKPVNITLEASSMTLGEVVIAERPSFASRVYYRFVRYPIRKLFKTHRSKKI